MLTLKAGIMQHSCWMPTSLQTKPSMVHKELHPRFQTPGPYFQLHETRVRLPPTPGPAVNFRPSAYPGVPARGSNIPVPMEVDATRRRNPIPMLCRRCGEPGHFAKECPRSYDVRYMTSEEKEEWIEQLLSDADVAKAEIPDPTVSSHATDPPQENPADFTSHSG